MSNNLKSKLTEPDILFWTGVLIVFTALILYFTINFIASFVIAIFFYYSTRPIYRKLHPYIKNEILSALTTIIIAVIPIIFFFSYILSIALIEIRIFMSHFDLTNYYEFLLESLSFNVADLIQQPRLIIEETEGLEPELITDFVEWSILVLQFLSDVFIHLLLMIIILFYLLKDDKKLIKWSNKKISLMSPIWNTYWKRVDNDLHSVFFGNILNMFITGFIAIIIFLIYNLIAPSDVSLAYPVIFGMLAGLSSLIPIIGMKLVYIPIAIYLVIVTFSINEFSLLFYVFFFIIISATLIDFIPDLIIRPYVSGKNLHLGMLIFAYISGPIIIGWYGFFLAPIILILLHHFTDLILPRLIRTLFKNEI